MSIVTRYRPIDSEPEVCFEYSDSYAKDNMDDWHTTVWKLSELHKAKIIIVTSAIEGKNGGRTCRVCYMVGFVGMVTALVNDGRDTNIDIVIVIHDMSLDDLAWDTHDRA